MSSQEPVEHKKDWRLPFPPDLGLNAVQLKQSAGGGIITTAPVKVRNTWKQLNFDPAVSLVMCNGLQPSTVSWPRLQTPNHIFSLISPTATGL